MAEGTPPLPDEVARQGRLWGAKADDYAELLESFSQPWYEAAFDATEVGPGTHLLDVGCGPGLACRVAADRGATVTGVDPAESFISMARRRVPEGDFRVGDMTTLPFEDACFDVVTGFNAFSFAPDPRDAIREARRVTKEDGAVVVAVYGDPEACELTVLVAALRPHLPPLPPDAPSGPFRLSPPDVLRRTVEDAGLEVQRLDRLVLDMTYPDDETALRALFAVPPVAMAAQAAGEDVVREALLQGAAPFRTSNGGYRIENEHVFAIAR